jgi:DNA-binding CsgD family transcriptional regulator
VGDAVGAGPECVRDHLRRPLPLGRNVLTKTAGNTVNETGPEVRVPGLINRGSERAVLDRFVVGVRAGEGQALVVRGEPGVGKTALLDYLVGRARGCRVARAVGVQSEMELAFAGLHQLCGPLLGHAGRLPGPQQDALHTVFGLRAGPPPDRFMVGLAALSLLSEAAGEQPLICVIDDQQWLDQASAQALTFAARRLAADPVGVVFAAREPGAELAGLPELAVAGLRERDARALLDSALTGPLDARVRQLIVAETRGNPLALLELPWGLTQAELAGGFGLPGAVPLTGKIEDSFRRQLEALPAATRRLLVLAAADPSGNPSLIQRAAGGLGIPLTAVQPAQEAGLVDFGIQVRFRHPLVRSAAYLSGSAKERQEVHGALAEVTDVAVDPDRRAWHRAQAAAGPDEEVAAELERSAGRAQARGGLAAAAAFLERSVLLTADPARRGERTVAAAGANLQAGAFERALELLAAAEAGPSDELQGARADLLRGQIAFSSGLGDDAPPLLLKAAGRLEQLDLDLARDTYLSAWGAAMFAGHLAGAGDLRTVSGAARAAPAPAHPPRSADLLLDALTLAVTDGRAVAAPALRQVVAAFTSANTPVEERLRWAWLAVVAADYLWDEDGFLAIIDGATQLARDVGALDLLPIDLQAQAVDAVWCGDFPAADALITENRLVCEATGTLMAPFAAMSLAAVRGREGKAVPLIAATFAAATAGGQGLAVSWTRWATAVLCNGLGRYADAEAAGRQASQEMPETFVSTFALPELIEAAARTGNTPLAVAAIDELAETTRPGGTDWGLGTEARCRALVSEGQAAERLYREAIERLGRTRLRPELARAHLLYGQWLRRENRRIDAREQLRTAYDMLSDIGMEAFAERARRELLATGETVRKRTAQTTVKASQELTPQEAQVAMLAREGLSNPEIGVRLFISSHTVQYHLSKVYTKLGIRSRLELHTALATLSQADPTP